MDPIKEAFFKIKQDILDLKNEISQLKNKIEANIPISTNTPTHNPTDNPADNQMQNQPLSSNINQPTNQPTQNMPLERLKSENMQFSIGNDGVPTHQHTNTPTHQHTNQQLLNPSQNKQNEPIIINKTDFQRANEIISSLDSIKKEIRRKFKHLTTQEMTVFSKIYSLEDLNTEEITYKLIASELNLSESSIRDYTNKLIKKGVPIEKIKQNNKIILLKISKDLKNIATLATIIQLREV